MFPSLLLNCPRYKDPDGVYDSLKEKAMVVLQEKRPTSPQVQEPDPEQAVCSGPLDVLESGLPVVESYLDLHVSNHCTCVDRINS